MRNTQIARNILRNANIPLYGGALYTNKYENCRTVKCYARKDQRDVILDTVLDAMDDAGLEGDVKMIHADMGRGRDTQIAALIIRLPLEY